jgi:hypothetical protein
LHTFYFIFWVFELSGAPFPADPGRLAATFQFSFRYSSSHFFVTYTLPVDPGRLLATFEKQECATQNDSNCKMSSNISLPVDPGRFPAMFENSRKLVFFKGFRNTHFFAIFGVASQSALADSEQHLTTFLQFLKPFFFAISGRAQRATLSFSTKVVFFKVMFFKTKKKNSIFLAIFALGVEPARLKNALAPNLNQPEHRPIEIKKIPTP